MRIAQNIDSGMFSGNSVEWETPPHVFDLLDKEFHFTVDVCATSENRKCEKYFDQERDGLRQSWAGEVCWMNPPYRRQVGRWLKKAYEEARSGATVVCLLPSRTDTAWWHDYVMRATEIRLVRGRLYFGDGNGRAPFPSCIVIFRQVSDVFAPVVRSCVFPAKPPRIITHGI
jgi:site-specific DNA-methyltransferase (adenine-specific)